MSASTAPPAPNPARETYARLPREPSRFIGRGAELAALGALFDAGHAVVTVLGPPGVGKTRLALRFANAQQQALAADGGAWFCDLAAGRDVDAMSVALARTLGLATDGALAGPDRTRVVSRALASLGPTLVVLDNLEQLLPHAEEVLAAWRAAAPRVRWLLTSRQIVRLPDAAVYELGPLRVPRPGEPPQGCEAVELFVDRVRAVRGRYAPGPDALRAIAEVVRQLNGLPLAIELTASRMQAISPAQLLPRLSHRLELLPRAATEPRAPRRLTMHQAVDWSWGLLHPWEQSALSQCAVFRGSFSLDAAEHVVDLPAEAGVPPVRDVVRALCDKSLLHAEPSAHEGAPPRYAMYEGIRTFAAGKVAADRAATDALAERHAAYYLRATGPLAGRAGVGGAAGLPPDIDRDLENLEAVLERGARTHRPEVVLRAAVALDALAQGAGLSRAQLARLDAALHASAACDDLADLRARALGVRALSLRALGRMTEAELDARAALAHALERGEQAHEAVLRQGLGEILFAAGDPAEALAQWRRALELARALGNHKPEVAILQRIGSAHQTLGELDDAGQWYARALSLALERRDGVGEARAALGMGSYHLERGLFAGAYAYYSRGLSRARALGVTPRLARLALGYLGVLHLDHEMPSAAGEYLAAATREAQAAGDVRVEGVFRAVYAAALAAQGRLEAAREAAAPVETLLDDNAFYLASAALYRSAVDLCEARARDAHGDVAGARALRSEVRARIAAAKVTSGPAPGQLALVARSDDARIAIRVLERTLARDEA